MAQLPLQIYNFKLQIPIMLRVGDVTLPTRIGFRWYELYVHSPHDLLSVQDSFGDHHVGSPLTLLGAGWHPPDAVPQRGDVEPLPPSELLHRKSFKLIQVLPTDGANCKETICNDPKRY